MAKIKIQSVEPNIADMVNNWLKNYGLDYKLEQESLNTQVDYALNEYYSKSGMGGGNRPDAKLLLKDKFGNFYPILIEYKGYKDKLVKLDKQNNVFNKDENGVFQFNNIKNYAVNGAIHYANALLEHTNYEKIIAIGVTGYKYLDKLSHEIGVYLVSKDNFGIGQEIGKYTDLSFLQKTHFDDFIKDCDNLNLNDDEIEALRIKREQELNSIIKNLNKHIYSNEKGISEKDRVYLVVATIMATLGASGVAPLDKKDLKSSSELGNQDGDIILRKIKAFLDKRSIPQDKKDFILRAFENLLTNENLNKVKDGESQIRRIFVKIVDELGFYYKVNLSTDFTGKLFNEMYNWLGFTQDKLNDVVLTPPYVATLLAKLARVDMNSYVWDFATGSAGLLVAAMNEMINNAKENIKSPDELAKKIAQIKAEQLLGLEVLPEIYMLAILNMILMGDGSSNILNKDSLYDFNGEYEFNKQGEKFPATAFVLNPPYSADGCGMIFVKQALSMMSKGYASVIIQGSAGSGKAIEYNKEILKNNTLIASIKMPNDLFVGKSSVQTYVYVFRVGEKHEKDEVVKFIDFSNDGYSRNARKKSNSNLIDIDNAKVRYQELVDLVRFGKTKLKIFSANEYYESTIDPENGADWNQVAPVDTIPKLEDFVKTIGDFLSWEIINIIKDEELLKKL